MSGSDKDEDYIDDSDFSIDEGNEDTAGIELTQRNNGARKSDALRRIEEYRYNKELKSQVEFFDEDLDGDDIFSDL